MGEPRVSPAQADLSVPPPARWIAPLSGSFEAPGSGVAPLITAADFTPIATDLDVWDAWPIQHADGQPVDIGEVTTLWMALGAPHFADPDLRHGRARIHLLQWRGGQWSNLGPVMPDGFSPGSREWSGSAVLDDTGVLTLYFTATGRRGELVQSFEQRLFRARATLSLEGLPHLTDWRDLAEVVVRDPRFYMPGDQGTGTIGTIKAFRDPAYFLDPEDGSSHLLFAASAANSPSPYNGVIGLASAIDDTLDRWETLPPIVSADGLNNELERPHVIVHAGMYYLFWSTQRHVFDPAGPAGPTGLYGMVADGLRGNWQPLNGTGLVFRNPVSAPAQAYSWLVMPDLRVTSFVDDWASNPVSAADKPRRNFG
ncbi:MAG TPA: glycoside hydrolase family 68 protein, partial [Paracoccaceae bacterium]|nr:glycoside hydrolase family 68 protein [Paracoccaceae bacterium]